jgi:SAM-dependent methyltransferase
MILNLGAGKKLVPGAINCDITKYPGIDKQVDLTKFPWPWESNSIDGIHASHVIEHFKDQEQFIWECLRVLKPGGFLRLVVPHSSSVSSVGCMGHYRTYSYNTLNDYLSRDFYMFGKAKFRTVEMKLLWWHEAVDCQEDLPVWAEAIIQVVNPVMNFFISLSPRVFENLWCYWVGGAREVVWKGEKI